ncbi:MAG: ATP-binding protein [Herbinix sp.]|nr:ATP-binding protein [Herbinix sp.]
MKKAIFQRFILILSLALILSGSIFCAVISNILLDKTEGDMLYSVRIVDHEIDYKGDLKSQLDILKEIDGNETTRFTIIDLDGKVIADSDVEDNSIMENHRDREEVKEALKTGIGYAIRESETLRQSMLYVASISSSEEYIIRIAVPFSGIEQYTWSLVPAILISIGVTLIISIILANRFAQSVTKPLKEIAEEMLKLKEEKPDFHFKHYQYDEMNVIADTTMQMSKSVKESMNRIEFERLVRQEFFSNASHELKTPLTSVRGYVELLENDMATNEKMKKDFLSRIKMETGNMTNLINDILMISRLETKEAEVVLSEVRICPLVKEVCNSLQPLATEYQVTVSMNCRPLSMHANLQQLRALLGNLITNAIKYNKPGGWVYITVFSESKDVVIIIEDTGVGIPEDSKQRVFERFYRVDKGRSKKVGGTGLGLSIVKHIVGFYNGSIELESKLMEGTRFTVRLPIKQNESDKI